MAVITPATPSRPDYTKVITLGSVNQPGVMFVGGSGVIIDGKNKRILINDGLTDRIVIGLLDPQ